MKPTLLPRLCLLFLAAALFLTGCGKSKAEQAVIEELDLIKELDEETITSFVSYEDMVHSGTSVSEIGPETTEAVQLFFKNFDYKILSCEIENDIAEVTVRITNLDMQSLAKDLCLELTRRSANPLEETSDLSMNDYFSLLGKVIKENSYKILSTDAVFETAKLPDGSWTIQNTDSLEDSLVSGFLTYLHDPYLLTPEEVLTATFDYFLDFTPKNWITYLDMNDIFSTGSSISDEIDLELANQIAGFFQYEIEGSSVQGDSAQVTVSITSLDLSSVLESYREKLLEYASTTEAVRATDSELAEKTAQILYTCLQENDASASHSLTLSFDNNGSSWEMSLDSAFTNAILGDLTGAVEVFSGENETETDTDLTET